MNVLFLLKSDVSNIEAQNFIGAVLENGGIISEYLPPRLIIVVFDSLSSLPTLLKHPVLVFYTQQAVSLDLVQYLSSEEEKKRILQWNMNLQNDKKKIGEGLNWDHPGFFPPDIPEK